MNFSAGSDCVVFCAAILLYSICSFNKCFGPVWKTDNIDQICFALTTIGLNVFGDGTGNFYHNLLGSYSGGEF